MIIALAGRRVDPERAEDARFPLANVGLVGDRLRRFLREAGATAVVGSGACGADLLAMEAAGGLGVRRVMILPFGRDDFRASSVADRPGDWGPRFDRVAAEVAAARDLVVLGPAGAGDPDAAYAAVNVAILDEAGRLASEAPGDGVLAVVVWDGRPRERDDLTASFAREAEGRGLRVAHVSTLEGGLDPPADRPPGT